MGLINLNKGKKKWCLLPTG